MKTKVPKDPEKYWKAIDAIYPRHHMNGQWHELYENNDGYCTDDEPNGHGNFGCKRCQAIVDLEELQGIKIWPRNKKMTVEQARKMLSKIDWEAHRIRVETEMAKINDAHRLAATKARATASQHVLL